MFSLVNAYLAYLAYLIGKKGREKRIWPVDSPPVNDAKMVGNGEQVGNRGAAHTTPPIRTAS